jgi:hypothetical protein
MSNRYWNVGGHDPSWWVVVNTLMNMTANLKVKKFLRPLTDRQPLTVSILLRVMHEVSFDVRHATTPVSYLCADTWSWQPRGAVVS